MENPIMINRVSHEEQRRIRDEAFRDHDEGRISIELKALQEMFPADDSRTGERIKAVTRYVNRAGGTTELCYDGEADIFDAEGILIMTVFGVDEHATHNIIKEHPQGFIMGPIEEDGYRVDYSIVNLDDRSIEAIIEMLTPAEEHKASYYEYHY